MGFFNSITSMLGGQDSPPVSSDANDPGLDNNGECDPDDACCHWYSYLTLSCLGQQIGQGVDNATKPIRTEVNTLVIVILVAVIIIVALILFGKNTGILASHLRIG